MRKNDKSKKKINISFNLTFPSHDSANNLIGYHFISAHYAYMKNECSQSLFYNSVLRIQTK